jgi:hypothetical protein
MPSKGGAICRGGLLSFGIPPVPAPALMINYAYTAIFAEQKAISGAYCRPSLQILPDSVLALARLSFSHELIV